MSAGPRVGRRAKIHPADPVAPGNGCRPPLKRSSPSNRYTRGRVSTIAPLLAQRNGCCPPLKRSSPSDRYNRASVGSAIFGSASKECYIKHDLELLTRLNAVRGFVLGRSSGIRVSGLDYESISMGNLKLRGDEDSKPMAEIKSAAKQRAAFAIQTKNMAGKLNCASRAVTGSIVLVTLRPLFAS